MGIHQLVLVTSPAGRETLENSLTTAAARSCMLPLKTLCRMRPTGGTPALMIGGKVTRGHVSFGATPPVIHPSRASTIEQRRSQLIAACSDRCGLQQSLLSAYLVHFGLKLFSF